MLDLLKIKSSFINISLTLLVSILYFSEVCYAQTKIDSNYIHLTAKELTDKAVHNYIATKKPKHDSAHFFLDLAIAKDSTYSPAYYQKARLFEKNKPEEALKSLDAFFQFNTKYDGLAKLQYRGLLERLNMFTSDMLEDTLENYHYKKCDSLVSYTIQVFNYPTSNINYLTSVIKGFYGTLFEKDPSIKEEFRERLTEFEREDFRNLFEEVLTTKTSNLIKEHPQNRSINDFYWGAFYSTGDTQYLDQILLNCQHWKNKKNQDLFLIGGTALWSMRSNSERDPAVREFLTSESKQGNKYAKKILKRDSKYFYLKIQEIANKRFN